MTEKKSRTWCFTFNQFDEDTEVFLQCIDCTYLVYGYEVAPETGRPHLQGYIKFNNARHFQAVRTLLSPAHIEAAKGNGAQNRAYCTKDGLFFEKGVCPSSPSAGGAVEKERWRLARLAAREGRFEDIPDDLYCRYQSSFKRMRKEDQPAPADLGYREKYGVWIYGPPRTGKSHKARHDYGDIFVKNINKWWEGYEGQANVLIDEFSPDSARFMTDFLKTWADRWVFSAETKGGRILARPQLIIVTSNYAIEECWPEGVDRDAILERFDKIYMPFKYVPVTNQQPL